MALQLQIRGLPQLEARLKRMAAAAPVASKRALVRQAEFVMTDSKYHYCPVKDGHLRASGHVVVDPKFIAVTWSYGGPAGTGQNREDVGYAVPQHEVLTYQHTVGEAEYLKRPLEKAVGGGMGSAIAGEVSDALEAEARR